MTHLDTVNHSRDASGMTYVYPVISRRAGGVSVGINLSPNAACNFRCIYCQVPNLQRGRSPRINLDQLRRELTTLLDDILEGDFMAQRVPENMRRLADVAFSGNGEPTSSPDFAAAVQVVLEELQRKDLSPELPVVLITNGTLLGRPEVLDGLEALAGAGGRVWFKLDGTERDDFARVNATPLDPDAHLDRLAETARRIPTWLQTCLFELDGQPPSPEHRATYIATLRELLAAKVPLRGVMLYSVARESQQPESPRLGRLETDALEVWADDVRALGLDAQVSP